MRILLTVHCFYPKHIYGTETYTLEIAKALKKMGHEVCILTVNSQTEGIGDNLYGEYNYDGVTVISLDTSKKPVRRFRDTYCRSDFNEIISNIIDEFKPDIIHCLHTLNLSVAFLKVIEEKGIPAILTMTDFFGICFNYILKRSDGTFCEGPDKCSSNCLECYFSIPGRLEALKKSSGVIGRLCGSYKVLSYLSMLSKSSDLPLLKTAGDIVHRKGTIKEHYKVFKKLIAPTDFLAETYISNGFPKQKIQKLNFGINHKPLTGYANPRRGFERPLTFGYIGQVSAHKGVDILVNAFNQLDSGDAELKIYGDTSQDIKFTEKLKNLTDTSENIQFLGTFPREKLGEVLSDIDILVIPSIWYENAPLVLLNALATRTPVIVSDVDGMNEFIKHDYNGFLFQQGNVQELYKLLKKCCKNPDDIVRISNNANYEKSIEDNVGEYLNIYSEYVKAK